MNGNVLLLLNLALSFYLVGTIWAHEIDILRSWKLINAKDFLTVQSTHWHKLPYWIFAPSRSGTHRINHLGLASSGRFAELGYLGKSVQSARLPCTDRGVWGPMASKAE
jgi:hypothetical protein